MFTIGLDRADTRQVTEGLSLSSLAVNPLLCRQERAETKAFVISAFQAIRTPSEIKRHDRGGVEQKRLRFQASAFGLSLGTDTNGLNRKHASSQRIGTRKKNNEHSAALADKVGGYRMFPILACLLSGES